MNLIKLYFTVAAIIVVAIWTDPSAPPSDAHQAKPAPQTSRTIAATFDLGQ